ncbi:MAG TPA: hypothetical protein VEK83_01605 [Gemmatimonadales bacterium]|nr:hypothetical protein [Gemmatimonadales bacterium]
MLAVLVFSLALSSAFQADSIQQAIKLAQRQTQRAPQDPQGFVALGDAYARRMPDGRFRAIEAYRTAERLARNDPKPSYRIARMGLWLGGDDGERIAREGLERVISLDPFYEDAWDLWLTVYRNAGTRRKMVNRLAPHRDVPLIKARMAQLLIEEEDYANADRLLDSALATDSLRPEWLALRAQSAFEAGDTARGNAYYQRALVQAGTDSSDFLWHQAIGIATPAELRAWPGVAAPLKGAWLASFWARRNPNLFAGINTRVAEHFARLRYARKNFPLLHPLVSYHRNALARALNLEPSIGERAFNMRCEVYKELPPSWGLHVQLPGVSSREEVSRTSMGGLSHLTPEELEDVKAAVRTATKIPPRLQRMIGGDPSAAFSPTIYVALGFDLREVDSTAARVGYNLSTGLDDRGLMYLRFGPPGKLLLGGDNSSDPQCASNELERWRYAEWGEVRFSRPSAFSKGLRTTPEMVFRPMNERQFEAMKVGLTRDATSEPAPLEFGVWSAQFRNATDQSLADIVAVTTRGAIAAALVAETGGPRDVAQSLDGYAVVSASPGRYALLVNARDADTLGRQTLSLRVRDLASTPAISDLLIAVPWNSEDVDRDAMLRHLRRDLTFRAGESVRVFAELYGLRDSPAGIAYHATYRLLKTDNPSRDIAREDWRQLGALTFEFDRAGRGVGKTGQIETLVVEPRYLERGTYLLRLEVVDNTAGTPLGRSTIALLVR